MPFPGPAETLGPGSWCSVSPWDIQAGGHGAPQLQEPTGVHPPGAPTAGAPPVLPCLAAPAVPVSQRARSWGRRGHVRCRDRPAASPPPAPTPGAGAAQLQAETCLANYRGGEDFRGFTFLPGHTWETTFTISQFLRNNSPPARPCPGSPVGSGDMGAPVSPVWVCPGCCRHPCPLCCCPGSSHGLRGGWCHHSLCGVRYSSVSRHGWGLTALP